jgi:putative acetyltransferase
VHPYWRAAVKIIVDDLSGSEIAALLAEHLQSMHSHSPPESVHALDLAGLRAPGITFFTAWEDSQLVGCGALKELDSRHGEIKSMRTAQAFLGRGVATAILTRLIAESKQRAYGRISLETGSGAAFEAALTLYRKFGFEYCEPFGDYQEDPFSRFMTLRL